MLLEVQDEEGDEGSDGEQDQGQDHDEDDVDDDDEDDEEFKVNDKTKGQRVKKHSSMLLTKPSAKPKDKNENKKPVKYFKGNGEADLKVWKSQQA